MADKVRIVLEDLRPLIGEIGIRIGEDFRVKELTNSLDWTIGQTITEEDARIIIGRSWVTVKIVKAPE